MRTAGWPTYLGFTIGWRYSPPIFLRWFFQRDAATALDLPDEERLKLLLSPDRIRNMHPLDRAFFADEDEMRAYLATSHAAFAQGYDGMCKDGYVLCTPWGFRVEDIRKDVPVLLWYGSSDRNVPALHGRVLAGRLRTEGEREDRETGEKGVLAWGERVYCVNRDLRMSMVRKLS